MKPIRVLIVDDHAILREGLVALLKTATDIEVVGEADSGERAIAETGRLCPDVVLMDVSMPGLGGFEATLTIRRTHPQIKVLMLTQHGDREHVQRFLQAGVAGYLLKRTAGADLLSAIRAVTRGGLVLDPMMAREALRDSPPGPATSSSNPYDQLTDREKQVLKLVAEGRSNKEVAVLLAITVKTAMSHREHLMEKLGTHNRTDLIRFAIKQGVITLE